MDTNEILKILKILRVDDVTILAKNIQIPCLLAEWREGHSRGSDHAGSMGISISPGSISQVHCFSCGFGGSISRLLQEYTAASGINTKTAQDLAGSFEENGPEKLAASVVPFNEDIVETTEEIYGECLLRLLFYPGVHKSILDRGLTKETLKIWECMIDPIFRRCVLPVRSRNSLEGTCRRNLVGAVGRTYVNHAKKYYNYFQIKKARFLYGEHLLNDSNSVVIVEGMFDTLLLWQELHNRGNAINVVGTMGAVVSKDQIRKLCGWFDEVILFLDNDSPGIAGQRKLAGQISRRVITRVVRYPRCKDPAELITSGVDVVSLIKEADVV